MINWEALADELKSAGFKFEDTSGLGFQAYNDSIEIRRTTKKLKIRPLPEIGIEFKTNIDLELLDNKLVLKIAEIHTRIVRANTEEV